MTDRQIHDFLELLANGLRNPLEPVRAAAEELRMSAPDPNSQRAGELILRQLEHMTGMIDAVVDLSQLERGQLPYSAGPVDLYQVIETAVEDCRPALEARSQRLVVEMADSALQVEGDTMRLVQVFRNLMSNAVKFTSNGGSIQLSIAADTEQVRVCFRDTGCGLDAAQLAQVFEPFGAAGGTDKEGGGLGLGLALTQRLVELHNGTITAHSDGPDQGAEFCVTLPLLPQ